MFRSSSYHTIDQKGRVNIPIRFQDVIKAGGGGGIMVSRMDSCLFAYTLSEWNKIENRILATQEKSDYFRRFIRIFIGGAAECNCDKQGRVLIPPPLRQYAQLEKEIVLVGVLTRFEIWSRDNWDKENELQEQDRKKESFKIELAKIGL